MLQRMIICSIYCSGYVRQQICRFLHADDMYGSRYAAADFCMQRVTQFFKYCMQRMFICIPNFCIQRMLVSAIRIDIFACSRWHTIMLHLAKQYCRGCVREQVYFALLLGTILCCIHKTWCGKHCAFSKIHVEVEWGI